MNNNTSKWAAAVENEDINEAIQRIAFSFGYSWANRGQNVQMIDSPILIFNPKDKAITYLFEKERVGVYVCKVVNTLEEVIDSFNNPPLNNVVGPFRLFKDGSVLASQGMHQISITKQEFDKAVVVRNEYLGGTDTESKKVESKKVESKKVESKKRLPVVHFWYRSSTGVGNALRKVMMVDDLDDSYACLDMEDKNRYKKFKKSKISGNVVFVGFSETKGS